MTTEETYTTIVEDSEMDNIDKDEVIPAETDCTDIIAVEPTEKKTFSPFKIIGTAAIVGTVAAIAWKKTEGLRSDLKAKHNAKKISRAVKLLQDNGINVNAEDFWDKTTSTEVVDETTE